MADGAKVQRQNVKVAALADLFEDRLANCQKLTWEAAIKSNTRLGPERYEFGPYPIPPVALPGQYKFS